MNNIDPNELAKSEHIITYFIVLLVGFIGGTLNTLNDRRKRGIASFILGTITSMFLGWMSFEVIDFLIDNDRVAVAGCGFFAWKGAEWAGNLVDRIISKKLADNDRASGEFHESGEYELNDKGHGDDVR